MAIELQTTLPTGVVANYWRIKRIEVDYSETAIARVEIALYANKDARDAGCEPLRCDIHSLGEIADASEVGDDFRGIFYDAIVALPEFDGAVPA